MQWQFYALVCWAFAMMTGAFVGQFLGGSWGAAMMTTGMIGLAAWLPMVAWFVITFTSDSLT